MAKLLDDTGSLLKAEHMNIIQEEINGFITFIGETDGVDNVGDQLISNLKELRHIVDLQLKPSSKENIIEAKLFGNMELVDGGIYTILTNVDFIEGKTSYLNLEDKDGNITSIPFIDSYGINSSPKYYKGDTIKVSYQNNSFLFLKDSFRNTTGIKTPLLPQVIEPIEDPNLLYGNSMDKNEYEYENIHFVDTNFITTIITFKDGDSPATLNAAYSLIVEVDDEEHLLTFNSRYVSISNDDMNINTGRSIFNMVSCDTGVFKTDIDVIYDTSNTSLLYITLSFTLLHGEVEKISKIKTCVVTKVQTSSTRQIETFNIVNRDDVSFSDSSVPCERITIDIDNITYLHDGIDEDLLFGIPLENRIMNDNLQIVTDLSNAKNRWSIFDKDGVKYFATTFYLNDSDFEDCISLLVDTQGIEYIYTKLNGVEKLLSNKLQGLTFKSVVDSVDDGFKTFKEVYTFLSTLGEELSYIKDNYEEAYNGYIDANNITPFKLPLAVNDNDALNADSVSSLFKTIFEDLPDTYVSAIENDDSLSTHGKSFKKFNKYAGEDIHVENDETFGSTRDIVGHDGITRTVKIISQPYDDVIDVSYINSLGEDFKIGCEYEIPLITDFEETRMGQEVMVEQPNGSHTIVRKIKEGPHKFTHTNDMYSFVESYPLDRTVKDICMGSRGDMIILYNNGACSSYSGHSLSDFTLPDGQIVEAIYGDTIGKSSEWYGYDNYSGSFENPTFYKIYGDSYLYARGCMVSGMFGTEYGSDDGIEVLDGNKTDFDTTGKLIRAIWQYHCIVDSNGGWSIGIMIVYVDLETNELKVYEESMIDRNSNTDYTVSKIDKVFASGGSTGDTVDVSKIVVSMLDTGTYEEYRRIGDKIIHVTRGSTINDSSSVVATLKTGAMGLRPMESSSSYVYNGELHYSSNVEGRPTYRREVPVPLITNVISSMHGIVRCNDGEVYIVSSGGYVTQLILPNGADIKKVRHSDVFMMIIDEYNNIWKYSIYTELYTYIDTTVGTIQEPIRSLSQLI